MRFIYVVVLFLLFSCNQRPDNQQQSKQIDTTAVVTEGKQITQAAFKILSSNLQQAIAEGGVKNALEFCSVEAMPLTDTLSTHYGIELRRASHRPRNPLNRADSLELVSIRKYLEQIQSENELKPSVYASDQDISYHAPIRISGKLCLNCHGQPTKDITNSDLKVIQELYPEDEATGFSVGELRGIWSIRFPADYFNPNYSRNSKNQSLTH